MKIIHFLISPKMKFWSKKTNFVAVGYNFLCGHGAGPPPPLAGIHLRLTPSVWTS